MRSKPDQILDAAMACFGRYSFRHTSIEKIAEVAGVSRPTVYQHFGGKEEIFRAVGARMLDVALAEAELASEVDGRLADRLLGVLSAKLNLVVGHSSQEFRGELIAEADNIAGDLIASFHQRLAAIVTDLLAAATDELDLAGAAMSASEVALLLLDALTGIEQERAPVETLRIRLRQLVELTVRGLGRIE